MHILALDTNSYRELGLTFYDNIDFKYLRKYLNQGIHELILLDVVYKEFLDYFKNEHIGKLITDYQNLILRFDKSEFVKNIDIPDLTIIENRAVNLFKENLIETCWKKYSYKYIESDKLIDFLIFNKHESRKDNTRDFIIWYNLLLLAKEYPEDKIVFISRDNIFTKNSFFKKLLLEENVNNIIVVESISKYLNEYGLRIDFVNDELLIESIPRDVIEQELHDDIDCFPSYVSEYYYDKKISSLKNESLEIINIEPYEYYTYSEDKNKVTIISSVVVKIKAIYEREKRVNLKDFEVKCHHEDMKHRVDSENRPIYENNVLFTFEGEIDILNKKIINQKFIDFIPDWNIKRSE